MCNDSVGEIKYVYNFKLRSACPSSNWRPERRKLTLSTLIQEGARRARLKSSLYMVLFNPREYTMWSEWADGSDGKGYVCLHRIVPIETGSTSHGPSTVAFKVRQFLLKVTVSWARVGTCPEPIVSYIHVCPTSSIHGEFEATTTQRKCPPYHL